MQVEQWLLERDEPRDPHLRGREGVHPGDHADAPVRAVRRQDLPADAVGVYQDGLMDDTNRDCVNVVERSCELCRIGRHLPEDRVPVQGLAAGEEPDLEIVQRSRSVRGGDRYVSWP